MKKIRAVLFDFDGTIFDTNKLILNSWAEVFRVKNIPPRSEAEVLASFGEPLGETMERWFPGQSEECIKIYRDYQAGIYFDQIEVCPGMDDLIRKLSALGYKLAIVTSRLTSSTVDTLKHYDLLKYFDAVVTCDDTDKHKPDPEPALLALEKLGISADEAIMIGDSRFDILCAHNAGVRAVLVKWSEAMRGDAENAKNCSAARKNETAEVGARVSGNAGSVPDYEIASADALLDILEA